MAPTPKTPDPSTLYDGVQLLPTPAVGDRVWWYERADKTNTPYGADVLAIEAPGRVQLKVIRRRPKGPSNDCLDGVSHVSSTQHLTDNANTRTCGGWDWLRDRPAPDAYDFHRREMDRKAEMRVIEKLAEEKRIAERKKRDAVLTPQ